MTSEMVLSPIIQTTPGSTRIFENKTIKKRRRCCCNCCYCFKCCDNYCRIPKKRYFLLLLGFLYFVSIEITQHYLYFPLIIAGTAFIVFYNFPLLVYFSNTKPIYYEDLFIDTASLPLVNLDQNVKKRFEKTFELTLVTTNALLLGALSDYWIYKTEEKHALIEIIGITGGILKIFQFVNNVIGSLLLYFLSVKIEKTVKKNKKFKTIKNTKINSKNQKNIELVTINNTKHQRENQDRLPIINEYDNVVVEQMQLPINFLKRSKSFKERREKNKQIKKWKQQSILEKEQMREKEIMIRAKENKTIKRNILLTENETFKRVGKKNLDSPHPLKTLENQVIKRESEKKIEKNLNRIQEDANSDEDCVIVDIHYPVNDIKTSNIHDD